MHYQALIIDDEASARSALKELLTLFCPEVEEIMEAGTAAEALQAVRQTPFDIVFVDIQLKRISGIQLAKQLLPYCKNLVFVTAHDQYAIEAFQAEALHYLLKPVDPQSLKDAIKRIRTTPTSAKREDDRLLLNTRKGVIILKHHEILYIQGEGNYCTFHCDGEQRYVVSKHLSHYEEQLNSKRFFRIHQSYLINLDCVRQVITQSGSTVVLKNDEKLPIARRRKDAFLKVL
ncbi:MAG: LytTR family DNA-binding domain-containing protein [Bacteroidota bacterium]